MLVLTDLIAALNAPDAESFVGVWEDSRDLISTNATSSDNFLLACDRVTTFL